MTNLFDSLSNEGENWECAFEQRHAGKLVKGANVTFKAFVLLIRQRGRYIAFQKKCGMLFPLSLIFDSLYF